MKDQNSSFPWDLPWEPEDPEDNKTPCCDECYGEDVHGAPWEPTLTIEEVSHLLDQMVMDIQHLELEVIRARYKLSFFLEPPFNERRNIKTKVKKWRSLIPKIIGFEYVITTLFSDF